MSHKCVINPVVVSDEDDGIFEPERSFSDVFNTCVDQLSAKIDKKVFKVALRFHVLLENPEML